MTLDSASSAAAVEPPALPEGQSRPAAAGPEDEDLGALVALLADPSAVSSEGAEGAESADHAAAVDDPLAAAIAADEQHVATGAEAAEPPAAPAEGEDALPAVIALPPPADWPAADVGDAGDGADRDASPDTERADVIALPDRSGETDADSQPRFDDALLRDIADAPGVSSDHGSVPGDEAWLAERGALLQKAVDVLSEGSTAAVAVPAEEATAPAPDDGPAEETDEHAADDTVAPVSAPDELDDTPVEESGESAPASSAGTGQPTGPSDSLETREAPAGAADFDDALLRSIADAPAVTSDGLDLPTPAEAPAAGDVQSAPIEDAPLDPIDDVPPAPEAEPTSDQTVPGDIDDVAAATEVSDAPAEAVFDDLPLGAVPPGPAAALAFAMDPDTELALRDGLFGYDSRAPDSAEPQVWQGGLRAAIAALSEGHSAPLIFVDVDGIPFPAGAIHELAAVCEVGTVVVAIGSDDTARPGRELLLAGVTDYLAKPLTAELVRAVAARTAPDALDGRPGGCVAGFIGSGGSGTTTLMTAAALQAAARGCYVSVLDLNRSVAAAALALGVEPAAGLDQLLEAAGRATPDSDMVEGVCARRSDRVEIYAHRWSPTPPPVPTPAALESLLGVLRLRSHLVLVDGFDDPALSLSPRWRSTARRSPSGASPCGASPWRTWPSAR